MVAGEAKYIPRTYRSWTVAPRPLWLAKLIRSCNTANIGGKSPNGLGDTVLRGFSGAVNPAKCRA